MILIGFFGAAFVVRDRAALLDVGSRAPNFTATDVDGQRVSLADLRGEVVFLNIWATWCPPCREEMPSMQRVYEELGPEGLKMVAVSIDAAIGNADGWGQAGGDVEQFVSRYHLSFDIWLDPKGDIQRTYRTSGVPETIIIDRDGSIALKVVGYRDWDTDENIGFLRDLLRS